MNAKQLKAKYNLAGVVTIEYDGSGDSGYINDVSIEPERDISEARDDLETLAYELLSEKYGGWEINEGSCGTITIDFATNKVRIEHNERVESWDSSESEEDF